MACTVLLKRVNFASFPPQTIAWHPSDSLLFISFKFLSKHNHSFSLMSSLCICHLNSLFSLIKIVTFPFSWWSSSFPYSRLRLRAEPNHALFKSTHSKWFYSIVIHALNNCSWITVMKRMGSNWVAHIREPGQAATCFRIWQGFCFLFLFCKRVGSYLSDLLHCM